MPEPTEWYRTIETGVESLKARIGAPDARDYHLDRFLKMARRVDEFAPTCPKCRLFQPEIDKMLRDLAANAPQILKEQKRTFLGGMEAILSHLHKGHKLISEGQNLAIWLSIGTAMGLALGGAFQNPAIGIPIGVGLSIAIGSVLDAQAQKEDKVI